MHYTIFPLPNSIMLILAGVVAFLLTYIFTFVVIRFCLRVGWVEKPTAGKIHTVTRPRIGGVAIFAAFLLASLLLYVPTLRTSHVPTEIIFGHAYSKELVIYILFIIASILIVAVHVYDDIHGLKPLPKLLAQTCAVLILLGPGFHTFHGVLFFGVHNPFAYTPGIHQALVPWYRQPELTLFIHTPVISLLAIPAVFFTWFWMTGMMNALNWIDGLDGLAAGVVAITGLFITVISFMLKQYSIATLAAIFTGAVAGFLPHNWNPARIIMGDSGSQFLGIGLAVLSIMGGAKFALILMVLGIPIMDVALVMLHRIRRGQHPMKRDELPLYSRETHLHYRLLFGGLNVRQVCIILYSVMFIFGLFALALSPIYKFLGFTVVMLVMAGLLIWSRQLQDRKAARAASKG